MVRSVLDVPAEILEDLPTDHKLTTLDREVLEEFIQVMTPFEEGTDLHQGDQYVTAGTVIPTILALRRHLTSMDCQHNKQLVDTLLLSVNTRLTKYVETPCNRRAAVLDPRFRLT